MAADAVDTRAITRVRLAVFAAAMLWSLSGAFVKLLTRPEVSPLGDPPVPGMLIAFYRVFFAGLIFLPALRCRSLSFHPAMIFMAVSFALMNALFILAMSLGTAANAIILQYTAPVWVYLASVFVLGEAAERRSTLALAIAMSGVGVIVADAWRQQTLPVVLIALGSGLSYAGVLLGLRMCRGQSPLWLTVVNHLTAALALLPVIFIFPSPTAVQLGFLALFGIVQMAIPYWLVSRGLRLLSPQEVGTITLLEPLLNPVWAIWVDARELPPPATFLGGGLILCALAYRYWPTRRAAGR